MSCSKPILFVVHGTRSNPTGEEPISAVYNTTRIRQPSDRGCRVFKERLSQAQGAEVEDDDARETKSGYAQRQERRDLEEMKAL
jgi:hypothetical protein